MYTQNLHARHMPTPKISKSVAPIPDLLINIPGGTTRLDTPANSVAGRQRADVRYLADGPGCGPCGHK